MPTGLDTWQPDQDSGRTYGGGANKIRDLILKQDDVAEVRFITDGNQIFWDKFHSVNKDGGGYDIRHCIGETEGCVYCETKASYPGSIFYCWVYVRRILYATPQPEYIKTVSANVDGRRVYVRDVNGPMVFSCRFGKGNTRFNALMSLYSKWHTLCDRDYDIKRLGSKLDTDYNFIPGDRAADDEVSAMFKTLPSIEDVALKKVTTLDGQPTASPAPVGSDDKVSFNHPAPATSSRDLDEVVSSLGELPEIPNDEDEEYKNMF